MSSADPTYPPQMMSILLDLRLAVDHHIHLTSRLERRVADLERQIDQSDRNLRRWSSN